MGSRGGGRGGARGGKPKAAIYEQHMLGGFTIAEIQDTVRREEGGGFFPKIELPQTSEPSEREKSHWVHQKRIMNRLRFTPYYSTREKKKEEIITYSDQFSSTSSLQQIPLNHPSIRDRYNPDFFPRKLIWEPYFEGKATEKGKEKTTGKKRGKRRVNLDSLDEAAAANDPNNPPSDEDGEDGEKEKEDDDLDLDGDGMEEEQEEDDLEGDYGGNYFDDGEEGGDDVEDGGGGGDGGDGEGGMF